jgi:hypothetical protein
LQSRKHGGGVSSEQQSMIEAISRSVSLAKQQYTSSTGGDPSSFLVGYGSEDSDGSHDGKLIKRDGGTKYDERKGKNDDDSDGDSVGSQFNDEDAYDTFDGNHFLSPSNSSSQQKGKAYVPMRKSTISFMNYVDSRRQSKLELNGPLYGSNSKTKGLLSGETMSTLSNTMSSANIELAEEEGILLSFGFSFSLTFACSLWC